MAMNIIHVHHKNFPSVYIRNGNICLYSHVGDYV